jgi:hypothetical protein
MLFAPSQIVGLIEIETLDSVRPGCLVAMGHEDESLSELLAWLTHDAGATRPSDSADPLPPAAAPVRRLSGLLHLAGECLPADLEQLRIDLADATAHLRLRLAAAS